MFGDVYFRDVLGSLWSAGWSELRAEIASLKSQVSDDFNIAPALRLWVSSLAHEVGKVRCNGDGDARTMKGSRFRECSPRWCRNYSRTNRCSKFAISVFCLSLVRFCFLLWLSLVWCPFKCSHVFPIFPVHCIIFGLHFGGSPSALSPAMHLPQLRPVILKVSASDPGNDLHCSYCSCRVHLISIFFVSCCFQCAFCLDRFTFGQAQWTTESTNKILGLIFRSPFHRSLYVAVSPTAPSNLLAPKVRTLPNIETIQTPTPEKHLASFPRTKLCPDPMG